MSDETPTAISPPTNDDNRTHDFQIQIKVDPFPCVPRWGARVRHDALFR